MTIALDLGASQIRSLRRDGDRLISRAASAIYAVLADTPAHRRLLDQAGVAYLLDESHILLLGDAAAESASLFRVPCRHLLPGGRIPALDPLARQLLSCLIEATLPVAASKGEICSLTLPSGLSLEASSSHADIEFYSRLVRLQGYEPQVVPASQSLILAELQSAAFTGIGLVLGASGCEATLAHRGQPVCHAQTASGGHSIDQQLQQRGCVPSEPDDMAEPAKTVDALTAQRFRESLSLSTAAVASGPEAVVAALVRSACEKLLAAFDTELRRSPRADRVPQPLAVICSGGLSQTPGFAAVLADVLDSSGLRLNCLPPRIAEPSAKSILRGLLVSGELESPRDAELRAA